MNKNLNKKHLGLCCCDLFPLTRKPPPERDKKEKQGGRKGRRKASERLLGRGSQLDL